MKSRTIIALAAALTLQISCLFAEPNYIEINSISDATCIGIKSLEDYENLINQNNVAAVFLLSAGGRTDDLAYSTFYNYKTQGYDRNISAKVVSYIAYINIGNTYFSFNLGNYKKISDCKEGKILGFENGAEYYEAKTLKLPNAELYNYYKKNTFASSEDCVDANEKGFQTSYEYYNAKEKGYENYSEYKEYLVWSGKGYKSKEDMQNSIKKDYPSSTDYYDGQANGFENYADYKTAKDLTLSTSDDLKTYNAVTKELDAIAKNNEKFSRNQSVFYFFIKRLEKGNYSPRVLAAALKDIYYHSDEALRKTVEFFIDNNHELTVKRHQKAENSYQRYEQSPSPITGDKLFSESELKAFIENANLKELGSFNKEKEIFTKK